jgi:hypothetical protein
MRRPPEAPVATLDRERKRSPHQCGCGSAFDVCYFDDRQDPMRYAEPVTVDVACPECGQSKTLSLPRGSDRTVIVEASPLTGGDVEDGVAG